MYTKGITKKMVALWGEALMGAASPEMFMICGVIFSANHPNQASTDGGMTFHPTTKEELDIAQKWNLPNQE